MEGILIALAVMLVLALPVMGIVLPLVAFFGTRELRLRFEREKAGTELDITRLKQEVMRLRAAVATLEERQARLGTWQEAAAPVPPATHAVGAESAPAEQAIASAEPSRASEGAEPETRIAPSPEAAATALVDALPAAATPLDAASDAVVASVGPAPEAPGQEGPARQPDAPPHAEEPPQTPPEQPHVSEEPQQPHAEAPLVEPELPAAARSSLEEQIGLVWFTRIGAAALLLGVAYFFKYAVDNAWIGPLGRVGAGALAGLAFLGFAEATRARTKAVFTHAILGIGVALLSFSAYASHAFYHLVPAPAAIGAIAVVSLLGGALAVRHRGEVVLVLSSVAALAAPVLLSTGEDRPLALFAYTAVVAALSLVASAQAGFGVAPWISVVGSSVLYLGWYERFFDASAAAGEAPAGAYHALDARLVPLAAVLVFGAEWLGMYAYLRARSKDAALPLGFLGAALLFLHLGAATLLVDSPTVLACALVALGLASTWLASREDKPGLLALPLVASAAALAIAAPKASAAPVPTMLALAAWGTVYVAGLLRKRVDSPLALTLVGFSGVAFAVVSALVLAPHRSPERGLALTAVVALLSLGAATLGARAAAPVFSLLLLLATAPFVVLGDGGHASSATPDAAYLALAGLWAATYAGAMALEIARGRAPTALRIAIVSVAGLLYLAIAFAETRPQDDIVRAGLLAAVGGADLALGILVRRSGTARRQATVLLGQALALFVAAIGVLLSGTTVTLIWAALAAVVTALAAGEEDDAWLACAMLVFACVLVRLLGFDATAPDRARELFFDSQGKEGALAPTFLLNARALSLLGSAAAAFVAARAARRVQRTTFGVAGGALAVLGHLAALSLVVTEARGLTFAPPSAPALLELRDAYRMREVWEAAVSAQSAWVSVVTTLAIGGYAAAVLGLGFSLRSALHRYLGLGLFAFALAKLGLWDVWNLPRVFQIGALVGTGALLLSASFLYARFGKRLVTLLRTGTAGTAGLMALLLAPGEARALSPMPEAMAYTHAFPVSSPLEAGELVAIPVEPAVYRLSRARELLADVRVSMNGSSVPYVIWPRERPEAPVPSPTEVRMVDPMLLPDGSFRATFDLAAGPHDQLALMIDGDDFVRETRIESSVDGTRYGILDEGTRVYRIRTAEVASESLVVRYPTSEARWVRVTLLAGKDGAKPRITGATRPSPGARRGGPERATIAPASVAQEPLREHASIVMVDMGAPGLPLTTVSLHVGTQAFERRVTVRASDDKRSWSTVGSGLVYRARGPNGKQESLDVALGGTRARYLEVRIENGDDAPIAVHGATAWYAPLLLVTRAEQAGAASVLVGNADAEPPRYDLGTVLAREKARPTRTLSLKPAAANPSYVPPEPKIAPPPPLTERYRTPFLVVLVLVVLGLGGWTVALLRKSAADADAR